MKWNLKSLRRMFQPNRSRTIRRKKHLRPYLEYLEARLAPANVPILSGHFDANLSGWNNQETVLNPTNVNRATSATCTTCQWTATSTRSRSTCRT
jgi:hypothetical protein